LRKDRLRFLQELSQGPDLFRVRAFDKTPIVVLGPAQVHECLVERNADTHKDPLMRHVVHPVLGEGLITSSGPLWRRQRRIMAPLFPPSALAGYAPDIVACTEHTLGAWQDGATLDLLRETTHITMNIAGKILFGVEMFAESDELAGALREVLFWTGEKLNSVTPFLQLAVRKLVERTAEKVPAAVPKLSRLLQQAVRRLEQPVLLPAGRDRRVQAAVALLDRRVQRMVDERRSSGGQRPDLLGRLLAARDEDGGQLDDKQLRDEILTLFVAGHETTAVTLAFTLSLLCRHPEIYRRARAQVDALGRPPTHEDLPRLELLLRCFKEAMRLYPPIPILIRETEREISLGGHRIPRDSVLLISPYATQHRADLWKDPEVFDPDRFLPEAEAARPRHAFLAFSTGPRICLGMHLALMEGPLVLATLLRHHDFELVDSAPLVPEVREALRPHGGVPLRIRRRTAAG
jgi:cytochrome P450